MSVLHKNNTGNYQNACSPLVTTSISHDLCSEKSMGVPFNISSYALLMHLVAHVCGLQVGEFVYTLGDYHIYQNHLEQVNELLSREPLPLPQLKIVESEELRGFEGLLRMRYDHMQLVGYQSHGKIAAPVAV